jgi:hypothetical protein
MKLLQTISLLAIFSTATFQVSAQEYSPFPTDSAVWYVVKSWPEYNPPPLYWFQTYKYEAKGDTIINNIDYTKLYSKLVFGTGTANYEGAYRVDVENERVYFLDPWYNTEALLYDFKLVPGDTIIITGNGYGAYNLICLDTSTMIINNTPHRTYSIYSYLSNGTECYTTWVKGIGSLRIPIETDLFCVGFEWTFDLSCFYYKEQYIYGWEENPFFNGCIGTNVGIEEHNEINDFTISPNPVTSKSQLVTNRIFGSNLFNYEIFDLTGQMIENGENKKPSDIIIQNNHFKKGIYLMRLYSYDLKQFYSIKFIIN